MQITLSEEVYQFALNPDTTTPYDMLIVDSTSAEPLVVQKKIVSLDSVLQ